MITIKEALLTIIITIVFCIIYSYVEIKKIRE
jgi:hypothetical protein